MKRREEEVERAQDKFQANSVREERKFGGIRSWNVNYTGVLKIVKENFKSYHI